MGDIENKLVEIEKKLDLILEILHEDVQQNCKKMGSHIDFVENVYDNVKNPLGFLCNKVNYIRGAETKSYSLDDKK